MTLHEDLPCQDLSEWTIEELDRYYYPDYLDVAEPEAAALPVSWHRRPRVLVGVISTAALAGVVASALLLTLETQAPSSPSQTDAVARITATPLQPAPAPQRRGPVGPPTGLSPEPGAAAETASPSPEPEPETEPEPEPAPAAVEPAAPPAAPPPAPPLDASTDADEPQGPRINVTRSPMSFAPAARG